MMSRGCMRSDDRSLQKESGKSSGNDMLDPDTARLTIFRWLDDAAQPRIQNSQQIRDVKEDIRDVNNL